MKKSPFLTRWFITLSVTVFCLAAVLANAAPVYAAELHISLPRISEIYPNAPGTTELGGEFIEIFNPSGSTINLSTYTLQIKDKPAKVMALSGDLPPNSYKAIITTFSLLNSGEVVQLVRGAEIFEEVSYSSGAQEDQSWSYFLEGWELTPVSKESANNRYPVEEPAILDVCPATPAIDTVMPLGYHLNESGVCIPDPLHPGGVCSVEISEISAQPLMNGQEYIEFTNNTESSAHLKLCKVRINTATERQLPDVILTPWERYVYGVSSGTIKNSAGAVTLIQSNNYELQYTYPTTNTNQAVNFEASALNGIITDRPTPGLANEAAVYSEEELVTATLIDCGPGKYRSPETNRCRTIEGDSELAVCAPDQERNPATNRCRKVSSASATLTPCESGQERNPETNRCRKVESANDLKPCDVGYERNPETNRCRKIASAVSGTPLKGAADLAAINASKYKIPIISFLLLVASGYALYEYRTDLKNKYHELRSRIKNSRTLR